MSHHIGGVARPACANFNNAQVCAVVRKQAEGGRGESLKVGQPFSPSGDIAEDLGQIFIADLADFPGMNAVWEKWVSAGHAPPRATVQAPLAQPQWRVEMVVTAAA